ncbi:MAG: hypothetical protein LBR55_06060 [Bacteroidales bacterium]|jgi:uncharacterized BrkB/YihY/UPF0761 family membrane protein|nr:hypothetical protein [Bacteroidales bacterium]
MQHSKILFWLLFTSGIIVLLAGIFLQFTHQTSTGIYHGIFHDTISTPTINGFVAICLGILILIFSFIWFRMYRKEKKEWDTWEKDDKKKKE